MITPRQQRLNVVQSIAERHGFTLADVLGRKSSRALSFVRFECMAALRDQFGDGLERIGVLFGNRHHTTVLYGINKWRNENA